MQNLCKSLNTLLADAQVFYVKLHNYHWNVTGSHFSHIHKETEELYNYFSELYDTVAERILQLGEKPLVTMKDILNTTRLCEESNTTFNDREVLHGIIKDLQHFHAVIKETSLLDDCDNVTAGFLDETLAYIEKTLWIFKATLN